MTQATVGTNVSEKPGGIHESDWKKTGGFATAPSDAVWMSLCIKLKDMTAADAYVFFDRALIGLAVDGQTVLSNWSEGAKIAVLPIPTSWLMVLGLVLRQLTLKPQPTQPMPSWQRCLLITS